MSTHITTVFIVVFLLTILVVRAFVRFAPEKTVTGLVRHKTLLYIHHIYIGLIILAIIIPIALLHGFSISLIMLSAIGLALCLDELSAWILFVAYPSRRESWFTGALVSMFVVYVLLLAV